MMKVLLYPRKATDLLYTATLRIVTKSKNAPVAQLDRVPGFEPGGREFESLRACHLNVRNSSRVASLFSTIEG